MTIRVERLTFKGSRGAELSARLDRPAGKPRAYAVFAHCFTCSKDINAARRISGALAGLGIAVLRFDFTGLGSSEGEFANTNFSSNVADLVRAAEFLGKNYQAPQLLIGHSLGGAAVLAAAYELDDVRAVATIGAPADAHHVTRNFNAHLGDINTAGSAEVTLGGRKFTIEKQFVENLKSARVRENLRNLKKSVLIMHSPIDETVGIENAAQLYEAAFHPKSFISLDGADHLLTNARDAGFAADMIAAWAQRYLDFEEEAEFEAPATAAVIRETGIGKFQNSVQVNGHRLLADEPESYGGLNSGPSPYDFLAVALGACTAMTLRLYVERKKLEFGPFTVVVDHAKVHGDDEGKNVTGKIDRFVRKIHVDGEMDDQTRAKLLEIADKCPVHKTLESVSKVMTEMVTD